MLKICIVLFTGIFFLSCSSTMVVTNKKYEGKNFSDKVLFILPFNEHIVTVENKDDVADDFEEDARKAEVIISELSYKSVMNKTKQYLRDIKLYDQDTDSGFIYLSQKDDSKFFSIKKRIGKDSVLYEFYVPKKETLSARNIDTDIILVVNKLVFGRNIVHGTSYYTPGHTFTTPGGTFTTPGSFSGGGSSESLNAIFEYIFYDYNENDVITYGSSGVGTSFLFGMKRSTWQTTFERIANELFKNTPFTWLSAKRKRR